MYKIFPKPKKMTTRAGQFHLERRTAYFETPDERVLRELQSFSPFSCGKEEDSSLRFYTIPELGPQAYEIEVNEKAILIYASKAVGFFYAVKTLSQMISPLMECVNIFDEPDIAVRGYMMDISRNKVPTLETIKSVVDLLATLKMNHFELYVEGFSFEYQSFKQYLQAESYITVEEYQALEHYANDRFIDLVPNQNGFGHMGEWLKQEELKDLAEAPEGIFLWGAHRPPSTLNPLDPRSIELVKQMYHDMLPYSNSPYFNMNFDEPFELGRGHSKTEVEQKGLANVYIDYTLKAYDEIKRYNKTPLIWGDVLIHHDEALSRLPKDMIFIDWGYDTTSPYQQHLKKLHDAKIPFMAAPGTSSWCSFLGRTKDALDTITNACIYVKEYQGEGVLLTDWGDFGHLQFLPISLVPLAYCGLMSYRVTTGVYRDLKHFVNRYIFQDKTGIIADCILNLGTYHQLENNFVDNGTHAFHILLWAVYAMRESDPISFFKAKTQDKILSKAKYHIITQFFKTKREELALADVDLLVKDELNHSISFVETLLKINQSMNEEYTKTERIAFLNQAIAMEQPLIKGLTTLWMARNKRSGLDNSIQYIKTLIQFTKILQGGIYE